MWKWQLIQVKNQNRGIGNLPSVPIVALARYSIVPKLLGRVFLVRVDINVFQEPMIRGTEKAFPQCKLWKDGTVKSSMNRIIASTITLCASTRLCLRTFWKWWRKSNCKKIRMFSNPNKTIPKIWFLATFLWAYRTSCIHEGAAMCVLPIFSMGTFDSTINSRTSATTNITPVVVSLNLGRTVDLGNIIFVLFQKCSTAC